MTTDRKFAAFSKQSRDGLGITDIPEDGFCISVFLIVRDADNPRRVLMGHLDPGAPWDHIGALTKDRVQAHSKGWMIPSSHLIYGESPADAVARVAREQLDLEIPPRSRDLGFRVYSEVYSPRRFPERKAHWDLELVYEVALKPDLVLTNKPPAAWSSLSFIDLDHYDKNEIARSHEDILARL